MIWQITDELCHFAVRPSALGDVSQGDGEAEIRQSPPGFDLASEERIERRDVELRHSGFEERSYGVQTLSDTAVEARDVYVTISERVL